MAPIVGEVAIKVRPDTDGFGRQAKREIEAQLRKMRPEMQVRAEFDYEQARIELSKLVRRLNQAARVNKNLWVKLRVDFDEKQAFMDLEVLQDLLQQASDEAPIDLTPQIDEDAFREMREGLVEEAWHYAREAAEASEYATDEATDDHEREYGSRKRTFQKMLKATQGYHEGVRSTLLRSIKDYEAFNRLAALDHTPAFDREKQWKWGMTDSAYDKAYVAARKHARRMMRLSHQMRASMLRGALALVDDDLFGRVGFAAGRLIAARLDSVDWRGLGRKAGSTAILGFADGVQRLSGLRIASHFTKDVWRPLADFDRYLPVVATFSSALATAAGAVGALGSNILGLARGVAQMFPAFLALPGAFASIGVGAWAVINGFKTMSEMAPEISKAYSGFASDMSDAFWKARTEISKNLIAIQGSVRKGMTLVSASMGASMGRLAESINRLIGPHFAVMFERTARGFAELFNHSDGIAGSIAAMGNIGTFYFPKMMKWVGELADKYREWIETAIRSGDAFHWIDTGWKRMKEFGSAVKETSGFFADLARIASDAGGASLKDYADGLKKLREGLQRGAQGAETLRKLFKASHDTLKGFTETVGPGLTDFLIMVGNLAEQVGPKLSKAFGTVIGSLLGGFATPAFQKATRTLADNLLQLADIVAPIAYQSSELVGIFDAINAAIVPFGKLGVAAVGGMLTAIDDLGPALVNVVDTLGHSAADFAIAVLRPVTEVIGDLGPILEVVANALAGVLDQNLPALRELMETFQDLAMVVQDRLGAALPSIAHGFGMFVEGIIRAADGVASLVDAAVRFLGTGFGAAIGGMATAIGGAINVLGTLVELLGKLVDWLVKGTDELGPFGDALEALGNVMGFGAGILAMSAGFTVAGNKARALAKGFKGLGGSAAAAGAGMTVVAGASEDVGKKSGKAEKGLRGTAAGMKGIAKGVGAAAVIGLVADGMSKAAEWGEGAARSGDQLSDAFDRAAATGGNLDDVFRSMDGKAIADNFFGIGQKVQDMGSALDALDQGWFMSGGLSSAVKDQFAEVDMVLSQLDYESASRNFKLLDDAIRETGRGSDVARDQMKNYADIIRTQLLTAGLDEYVNDTEKFSAVLRGELDDGLVRTERGFESAATAARKLRDEMRTEYLGQQIQSGLDLIPQYAARTMSQTTEEIRSSIDGLGQIFVDNMPEIKEYWTQIGGGGEAGAKLADQNVKILTSAFDQAQAKLSEFGGNVADYGGSWSQMMNEMYASGGKQAQAAKDALKIIGDALKATGLDYGTLQQVVKEMDLSPDVESALLELMRFTQEAPGHVKEGMGAAWLAVNEEQRIAMAQMAEDAIASGDVMTQAIAETKLRWIDGANEMGISIDDLRERMKRPATLFEGSDLTYDAKVKILDLMGIEGRLRSQILQGVTLYNGMDPTESVGEQFRLRAQEAQALRDKVSEEVPQMNDPTNLIRAGVGQLNEQLAIGLPKTGVSDSAELQGAYDAAGSKATSMSTAVANASSSMQAKFQAAAIAMSGAAGAHLGVSIPGSASQMASKVATSMATGQSHMGNFTNSAKSTSSQVATQYSNMSRNAGTMATNTGSSVDKVGTALGRIPTIARSATSGASTWLWSAGQSIISGLVGGIRSMFGSLTGVLSTVTSMIPRLKGPPEKDAILLRPAGQLIMEGLAGGLWDSFQTDVKPALTRISDEIANTRIDPLDVDMSARTDLYSAHRNVAGRNDATGGGNNVSVTVQYPHPDSTPRAIQRGAQTAAALL